MPMLKRILEWSLLKIKLREIRQRRRERYEHARRLAIALSSGPFFEGKRR